MTPEKAIKHFHFKLSKVWKASDQDIQAFTSLRDFVVTKQKEQLNDNVLFAKLYIYVYEQFLRQYKATVFDDIPQKELNKLLARDLSHFISDFTNYLNESELYTLLEEKGFKNGHPALKTENEKIHEKNIIENLSQKEITTILNPAWTTDVVEPNLVSMINGVLNQIK